MREIVVTPGSPARNIPLYQEGEDGATCIVFDLAPYIAQWGDGTAKVLHQRPGDAAPYPVQLTREGDRARWLVQSEDILAGSGELQLIWQTETARALSPKLFTFANASLGVETEPPEKLTPWMEQIEAELRELKPLAETFFVIKVTDSDSGELQIDVTQEQIQAAFKAGKRVYAAYGGAVYATTRSALMVLDSVYYDDYDKISDFYFQEEYFADSSLYRQRKLIIRYQVHRDGADLKSIEYYPEDNDALIRGDVPKASMLHNGKVLGVQNGHYALLEI